ncbi:MAG: response regulator transcription factor [Acidobacteria bacterium]|nr:response regulator transcription factor [Acidobacteriota bacterium]MCB9398651.1 response regulator transcription factor [Acidobacteriota bacterium]
MARKKMARFIEKEPRLHLIGFAEDGPQSVKSILELRPDLVFLDIQMPGMDGFRVLEAVKDAECHFHLVFTTAFNQHAVKAFDYEAIDYLLKPFDVERFQKAVDRVLNRQRISAPDLAPILDALLHKQSEADRLAIRQGNQIELVTLAEIGWVEADDKYIQLHSPKNTFLHRMSLKDFLVRYGASGFVRTHRRYAVKVQEIQKLIQLGHGDYEMVLRSGARLPLSRAYAENVLSDS